MGKCLTKVLKDRKKPLWPSFHVKCSSFTLANFIHAIKESIHIEALRLHTLPKRKFDLDKVAYNINTIVKLQQ